MARRQRDYKAEYAARVARGKEQGLTRAQAAGHAARAKVPSITALRASGRLPARRPKARAPKLTIPSPEAARRSGVDRVIHSADRRYLIAEVKAAAAAGKRVSIRSTFDTDRGYVTQTLGGARPHKAFDVSGRRSEGKTSMTIGRQGIDAQELLDALVANGWDWDEAIADLWAEGIEY